MYNFQRNFCSRVNKCVMAVASATFTTVLVVLGQALAAVFAYLLAVHNSRHDNQVQKQEKIDNAKQKVDDACDHGSLSDLLDATKELGDAKK